MFAPIPAERVSPPSKDDTRDIEVSTEVVLVFLMCVTLRFAVLLGILASGVVVDGLAAGFTPVVLKFL